MLSIAPPAMESAPALVVRLAALLETNPTLYGGRRRLLFAQDYTVPPSERTVRSWRIDEFAYGKPQRPLPTNARGLFTYSPADGSHHIVVRGYDKFFNVGQNSRTTWAWIEAHSRGPYALTLKENGCIIFVAAMPDGGLIVTSKHAVGTGPASHSARGMHWLRAHLAAAGKTPDGLAAALRAMDATAVAELCDDQFEEHILAYPPHRSGLYLHGINRNTPQFVTYPFARVCAFAREWGFRQTPCLEKHDVPALRSLLADAATTGSWAGTPTEGFVVRCQARDDLTADDQWYDYFFKYKFDEPYLMYRQWRELTKDIIANRVLRNMHKKNAITRSYVRWARKTLAASPPDVASQYLRNHGIIALREEFLKQYAPKPTDSDSSVATEITTDTPLVLVPVATVGCGKTSVALALARLFGWAHVQNDDNTRRKGAAKHFASLISEQLDTTNICIADRNNHLASLRQTLIDDISRHKPDARFIALHWVHDNSAIKKIYKTTLHRVLARGDNHQSIQASDGIKQVLGIMDGFLHSFQPCNDDQSPDDNFDFVIDLHPLKSSRENLETVITTLRQHFPAIVPEIPPPQDLDDAIKFALEEYHPQIRKNVRDKLLYFAGVLDHNMVDILESIYAKHPESNREFFDFLRANQGFKAEFHVTLAHLCDKATHPQIWQHYKKLLSSEITTEIELQLQEIVWNDRIMCVPVTLVQKDDDRVECTHEYPHITIGLANDTVKPVEALQMLQKRATGELDDIHSITIHQDIKLNAHVRGITYKKGPQA